ncbi:MAG TPA: TadE family type IV pilus minor pilin [Nitriliruptorales bacterium]
MTTRSRRLPSAPGGADGGLLSLEFALVVPVLFVLVFVLFELTGVARDALAVQNAAREGARVAATHAGDTEVRRAVTEALDGRVASVTVSPRLRRTGQLVRVEVHLPTRSARLASTTLRARATARVEPVVR